MSKEKIDSISHVIGTKNFSKLGNNEMKGFLP